MQVKCEVYWPRGDEGSSVVFGGLEVTLSAITTLADYCIRSLQVQKVSHNTQTNTHTHIIHIPPLNCGAGEEASTSQQCSLPPATW